MSNKPRPTTRQIVRQHGQRLAILENAMAVLWEQLDIGDREKLLEAAREKAAEKEV